MRRSRNALFAGLAAVAVAAAVGLGVRAVGRGRPSAAPASSMCEAAPQPAAGAVRLDGLRIPANQFVERADGEVVPLRPADGADETADGGAAADEEAAVAAWDALVAELGEPLGRPVGRDDRARVSRALKRLARGRRREAVQSLVNVVGDADVGVAGDVLLDRSQPVEVVEAVFNDLLNRPDEVKRPFLEAVAADEAHAACAEARRMLDVQRLSAAGEGEGATK